MAGESGNSLSWFPRQLYNFPSLLPSQQAVMHGWAWWMLGAAGPAQSTRGSLRLCVKCASTSMAADTVFFLLSGFCGNFSEAALHFYPLLSSTLIIISKGSEARQTWDLGPRYPSLSLCGLFVKSLSLGFSSCKLGIIIIVPL